MNIEVKLTGHADIDKLLLKTYALYDVVNTLNEEIEQALDYECKDISKK